MEKGMYYVYAHRFKGRHTPFYIGQGKGYRAWQKAPRSRFWKDSVAKHGEYEVVIIYDNLTQEEATSLERFQIALWGRRDLNEGVLVNLTDGGEYSNPSKETRKVLADHMRNQRKNPNFVKKNREVIQSIEYRTNHSKVMSEVMSSQDVRDKIASTVREQWKDPEYRARLSEKQKLAWKLRRSKDADL